MTWIKLCGMTRRADVEAAAEVGADAVGFVIAPESPRRVSTREAARLGRGIDIDRYLVTVDVEPGELLEAASEAEVNGVQPHGRWMSEAAAAALAAGYRVLWPVPVTGSVDLGGIPTDAVPLLDTAVTGRHGGTGRRFDWRRAQGLGRDFVLAGGLNPDNVGVAVERLGPWGIDVASGIEASPGIKDPGLMARFVEAAR